MATFPSPGARHTSLPPLAAHAAHHGRAFLYVLVAAGPEDLLKIGLSHDPLQRWSGFHPRWFEAFDLDHSLLVETESRADAQQLETQLHRLFAAHQCPIPLGLRLAAGGHTEWYRGAYPAIHRHLRELAAIGHVVHWTSRDWLHAAMRLQRERLFELLHAALEEHHAGWLSAAQGQALRNLLDAHRVFDAELIRHLPIGMIEDLGLFS